MNFILTGNLSVIWNDFIYEEAREIIERLHPKYSRLGIDYREVVALLDLILDPSDKVSEMPQNWPPVSLDRDDDPFLFAAIEGNAEYIISADIRHMLTLGEFRGIPIGKPINFFSWAQRNRPFR
ncbi:PIN domain-containing protein [Zhaonella formicivorans]|uniref:PIN domain-containing protein n=1 Tax=Zhaonella formicivorans TaxID=2528593 RepID=UPI0022391939|nr:PIN domain-containing protein [Zhaonella formicivorans]